MTVYLLPLSVTSGLVLAFFALFGLGFGPPNAGSGLWWLTRPLWLLGLMAALSGIATWLSPLERGRSTRPSAATHSVVAATGAGMGAALISFGLLGYVASGLQPAAHGSSMLLFVPVDPLQNTVCVLAGLAVSCLAARSVRSA